MRSTLWFWSDAVTKRDLCLFPSALGQNFNPPSHAFDCVVLRSEIMMDKTLSHLDIPFKKKKKERNLFYPERLLSLEVPKSRKSHEHLHFLCSSRNNFVGRGSTWTKDTVTNTLLACRKRASSCCPILSQINPRKAYIHNTIWPWRKHMSPTLVIESGIFYTFFSYRKQTNNRSGKYEI